MQPDGGEPHEHSREDGSVHGRTRGIGIDELDRQLDQPDQAGVLRRQRLAEVGGRLQVAHRPVQPLAGRFTGQPGMVFLQLLGTSWCLAVVAGAGRRA